jgi:uncharacterized protein YdeI (YjbR/CyaY-like superfamily)
MPKLDDLRRVDVASRQELRKWLKENHRQTEAIWLVRYKKSHPKHIPWPEIVDEALCFGWIDSLPRKRDEESSLLLLSPRNPKSAWSGINKAKVEKLIADRLMTKAGLKMVKLAKTSGTWDKLKDVEAMVIPADLASAFSMKKVAQRNFDAFPPSVKRGILDWISQAKRPGTRASRIVDTVAKAEENIRANQWRK